MGRVFFLASHKCVGESGGGHGVEYRLYMAEKKYNLFKKEVIYVSGDRVIKGRENIGDLPEQKDTKNQPEWRVKIKKYIPSILRIMKMENMYRHLDTYLSELNQEFGFTNDDIFICHDFRIARTFVRRFSFAKCAMVHHMQGSIYFEWSSETGIHSKLMQRYFNATFREITSKIRYLCFPSKGTEESLINSEPALKQSIKDVEKLYLYNGVDCPDVDKTKLKGWIKEIESISGYKFVTVANLNAAKAVERIPQYLYSIKKLGISFKWILVGDGVQASEVKRNIDNYKISDDVIWIQGGLPHQQVLELFSVTDFYILFHKYSIFDLSTLEAMHYGNIPILTPVGGNKEIIIADNGLFVSDFESASTFQELINNGNLSDLKEKNIKIQMKKFDDKAFLKRYIELCDML